MKKIIQNLILGVVILVGIIVSLANAANDYGLRSNNLHSHILAQSTENGTSTNGPSGGIVIYGFKIIETTEKYYCHPNPDGVLRSPIDSKTIYNCDPDEEYVFQYLLKYCVSSGDIYSTCDTSEEGTFFIKVGVNDEWGSGTN